jgi:hypothetical protein
MIIPPYLSDYLDILPLAVSLGYSLSQCCIKTDTVNDTKTSRTDLQNNPTILFYIVELLSEQIDVESALCSAK